MPKRKYCQVYTVKDTLVDDCGDALVIVTPANGQEDIKMSLGKLQELKTHKNKDIKYSLDRISRMGPRNTHTNEFLCHFKGWRGNYPIKFAQDIPNNEISTIPFIHPRQADECVMSKRIVILDSFIDEKKIKSKNKSKSESIGFYLSIDTQATDVIQATHWCSYLQYHDCNKSQVSYVIRDVVVSQLFGDDICHVYARGFSGPIYTKFPHELSTIERNILAQKEEHFF